jgi:hypothetical protein
MAKPVVVSPQALEGINAQPSREIWLAPDAPAMVDAIIAAMNEDQIGPAGRQRVLDSFSWCNNLVRVDQLLEA